VSDGERVYVVARDTVLRGPGWYGVRTDRLREILDAVAAHGTYEPRDAVEQDPALKQVIPYLILRDGDRYFLMKRTRSGRDERLHDRYSIGVGGHVNPGDGDVHGGLRREWHEELDADFVPAFTLIGALNDDTTDVGRVHLGLVYVADAAGRRVAIRETDKLTGRFVEPAEVAAVADDLETWSRIVFEELEGAVR
jgi:predicted NUDIX family phosphoesterase